MATEDQSWHCAGHEHIAIEDLSKANDEDQDDDEDDDDDERKRR